MSHKCFACIGLSVIGLLFSTAEVSAQFLWDHSCADPEADWHTCCETPAGLKDNNWDIEPVPPPDCPPLPGPNDDVSLGGAIVRLFVQGETVKSISSTGHFRCFKPLNVAESALLSEVTLLGNGALNVNGAILFIGGPLHWHGGDIRSDQPDTLLAVAAGPIEMLDTGNKQLFNGAILQCDGAVTWSGDVGNDILLWGDSLLINTSSFTITNNTLVQGDNGTIRNEAPFTKTESTGVTTIDAGIAFDNTAFGFVDVQTGTLKLNGGGTSQGAWNVRQGATLQFQTHPSNPPFTFTAPTGIGGNGLVWISGNGVTANVGAPVQATNVLLTGDLHGPGTFFFTNLEWPGGTMDNGLTEVLNLLTLSTGFGNPVLMNHTLQSNVQTIWDTGTSFDIHQNSTFRTSGQTTVTGPNKQVEFVTSEWINLGATNLLTNVMFGQAGATGRVGNAEGAVLNIGPGSTVTSIVSGVDFDQFGTVNVNTGEFWVSSGESIGGVFNVAPAATLVFQSGVYDVQNVQINGPGLARINGGNLRVVGGGRGGTTTVENLTMALGSARISGTGTLEVTGLLRLLFGAMVDPGLTLASGTLLIDANILQKFTLDRRTLRNTGTGIWNTGRLSLNNGATFHNAAGATLDVMTADDVDHIVGDPGTFLNDGYFVKSAGGAQFAFLSGVQLINSDGGIVDVQNGEVAIQGGGSNAGLFQIANGSAIIFNSTPGFALNDGADIQGLGPARLTGGSLIVNALSAIVDRFDMPQGTLTGPGTLTVADSGTWTNGAMTGTGTTAIDSGASFLIDSNVIKAVSQRALDVDGVMTFRGGALRLSDGAALHVNGLFLAETGTLISSLNTGSVLVDALGNFSVQSPLSITNGVLFLVSGAVNVLSNGRLTLSSGGNFTGGEFHLTDTEPGNELILSASSYVLDETDVFGPGQMQLGNATMTIAGNTRIDKLLLTSGTVNGPAELIVNQQLDWSGGTMQGPGLTTNAGTARLAGNATLAARTFNNNALLIWGNPPSLTTVTSSGGAVLNNFVNFEIVGNDNWSATAGGGTINNFQTFLKTAGTGTSTISPAFNHNAGLLQAQTGTISFNGPFNQTGGTLVADPAGSLRFLGPGGLNKTGGQIVGGGSLIGSVTNNGGPVKPGASPGTLTINGTFNQGAAGQLEIEIAGPDPGTQHDVLAVTGAASLGGTLRVRPVGGFVPAPGTQFTILTAGSVDGEFADVVGSGDYSVAYNPADVVLTVVASPIPGDLDGDDSVNLADYSTFAVCFAGPGVTTPPAGCSPEDFAAADLDGDGDVDLGDFASFANYFGATI